MMIPSQREKDSLVGIRKDIEVLRSADLEQHQRASSTDAESQRQLDKLGDQVALIKKQTLLSDEKGN